MHIIIWHLEKYCHPSLKVHTTFWLRHVQLGLQWVPVCLNTIVLSVRKNMFPGYSQPVMHFLQQCAKSSTSRGHWGSKCKVDTDPLLFDTVHRQYEAPWTPCLLEVHSRQFIVEHCPVLRQEARKSHLVQMFHTLLEFMTWVSDDAGISMAIKL